MIPSNFEEAFERVKSLAGQFAEGEAAYMAPRYQEAEVRSDFLNRGELILPSQSDV